MASSPTVTCAAPAAVSECVDPAPAATYAAPAPEEASPALAAARQHMYDLAVCGLEEGDPEMGAAVEHYLLLKFDRVARKGVGCQP